MSGGFNPPQVSSDLHAWARSMVIFLQRTVSKLRFKTPLAPASEDGLLMWDPIVAAPVFSAGGAWHGVAAKGGYALLVQHDSVIATASGVAAVVPMIAVESKLIDITGLPSGGIVFEESGLYSLSYSAQVIVESANQVDFSFWLRVNGVDATNSGAIFRCNTMSRLTTSFIIKVDKGDNLAMMWSVSDLSGHIASVPATAYSPVAPAVSMTIVKMLA